MNKEKNNQPSPTDSPATSDQVIQPIPNSKSPASSRPQPASMSLDEPVAPTTTQPTAVMNEQAYQPTTPLSSNQLKKQADQKPSKWRYFFIVLGFLQSLGIAIFFLIIMQAIQQAKAGASGTEFIALLLYVTLVPAVGLIALINLIGLPIYMKKHKPRGKGLVFSILSLAISAIFVLYVLYVVYAIF